MRYHIHRQITRRQARHTARRRRPLPRAQRHSGKKTKNCHAIHQIGASLDSVLLAKRKSIWHADISRLSPEPPGQFTDGGGFDAVGGPLLKAALAEKIRVVEQEFLAAGASDVDQPKLRLR